MGTNGWKPSRYEQRVLWWLQLLMRYGVGGGGLVWETLIDRLRNPFALLVFGALATSMDVFKYVKELIRQAREESVGLEREVKRELDRDKERDS